MYDTLESNDESTIGITDPSRNFLYFE